VFVVDCFVYRWTILCTGGLFFVTFNFYFSPILCILYFIYWRVDYRVHRGTQGSTGVHRNTQGYRGVHRGTEGYTGVHRSIQGYTGSPHNLPKSGKNHPGTGPSFLVLGYGQTGTSEGVRREQCDLGKTCCPLKKSCVPVHTLDIEPVKKAACTPPRNEAMHARVAAFRRVPSKWERRKGCIKVVPQ